jgi:hypothetical protein
MMERDGIYDFGFEVFGFGDAHGDEDGIRGWTLLLVDEAGC